MPVTASKDPPVDQALLIARAVCAMLGELHGKSVVRRAVKPGQKALDDEPSLHVEPADLLDDVGTEIFLNCQRHGSNFLNVWVHHLRYRILA